MEGSQQNCRDFLFDVKSALRLSCRRCCTRLWLRLRLRLQWHRLLSSTFTNTETSSTVWVNLFHRY